MIIKTSNGDKQSISAEEIICKAKEKRPVSVCLKGWMTSEEIEVIEEHCRISVPSIYMDGSATFYIRWDERSTE